MSSQYAFKPTVHDRDSDQPDALAKYRLAPGAIAASEPSAAGQGRAVLTSLVGAMRRLSSGVTQVVATLQVWRDRAYSRRNLFDLDERMMRDIGVSHSQWWHETNKPFWRE
jgi:uncharacterized protein YjiS (DUF1127 family)